MGRAAFDQPAVPGANGADPLHDPTWALEAHVLKGHARQSWFNGVYQLVGSQQKRRIGRSAERFVTPRKRFVDEQAAISNGGYDGWQKWSPKVVGHDDDVEDATCKRRRFPAFQICADELEIGRSKQRTGSARDVLVDADHAEARCEAQRQVPAAAARDVEGGPAGDGTAQESHHPRRCFRTP